MVARMPTLSGSVMVVSRESSWSAGQLSSPKSRKWRAVPQAVQPP
jgi:hypothetical protein